MPGNFKLLQESTVSADMSTYCLLLVNLHQNNIYTFDRFDFSHSLGHSLSPSMQHNPYGEVFLKNCSDWRLFIF